VSDTAAERRLYRLHEAAEVLGLGVTTVKGLVASGELRSIKLGAARRVSAMALDEFVARIDGADGPVELV
jgi:excisionase family DNA binding protein